MWAPAPRPAETRSQPPRPGCRGQTAQPPAGPARRSAALRGAAWRGHPAAKPNELCPLLGSRQVKNFNQRPPIFRNRVETQIWSLTQTHGGEAWPCTPAPRCTAALRPRPPPARHPARASAPARPAVARSRAGFGSARAGGGAAAGATGKGHGGDASAHERGARRSSPRGAPSHGRTPRGGQGRSGVLRGDGNEPQQTQQCHPAGSAREEMKQRACQNEGDTEGGHRKGDIWPEKGPEGASCAKTREATPRPGNRQCKGPEVNGVPARRVGRLDRRAGSGGGERWGGGRLRQRPGTGGARRGRQRRLPRARWPCPALTLLRGA